jgi:DNA-binding transcriptional LysR family regulator
VVFDGIVPIDPLLRAVGRLVEERVPTRIDVRAEFLAGVEEAFERTTADLMIAVLPPRDRELAAIELPPLRASLVARADHVLARGRHTEAALRSHLLLTVRGSDPRLDLPTAGLEACSTIHLNDFMAKRAAILAGIGFGWLPDVLIGPELGREKLRRIRWARPSTHVFHPRLYHRGTLGPAARRLISALAGTR